MRDATLVFLIKKTGTTVSEICLALKKRGFGVNRWNGVGGKLKEGETIEEAAKRETTEEIGVVINSFNKVAELLFYVPHNPSWDQNVHVYFSEDWQNEPTESEEMRPQWFNASELPFEQMWPDDQFWVPQVLQGQLLKASFTFGEGDIILKHELSIIENF